MKLKKEGLCLLIAILISCGAPQTKLEILGYEVLPDQKYNQVYKQTQKYIENQELYRVNPILK